MPIILAVTVACAIAAATAASLWGRGLGQPTRTTQPVLATTPPAGPASPPSQISPPPTSPQKPSQPPAPQSAEPAPPAEPAQPADPATPRQPGVRFRVATFNMEDVRTDDLQRTDHPRLKLLAEVLQRLRPTVILLNEIAYDMPGAPGFVDGSPPGQNARLFAERFLAMPQAPGLEPLRMKAFMAPVNTGIFSGFDLDNDGRIVDTYPTPPPADADGKPGRQTAEGRAYGGDCWGFGTFPGQYGMAVLVDDRVEILTNQVRTFRLLPWDYLPGAALPPGPSGEPGAWFSDEERAIVRLSSKSHWDVPIRLPLGDHSAAPNPPPAIDPSASGSRRGTDGPVVHLLCSHPTPPVFDGPEDRNGRRNHDEIRFWAEYIDGASWIVDDAGVVGGLRTDAPFVVLGDLNADPTPGRGNSYKQPIAAVLFGADRLNSTVPPRASLPLPGLEDSDTALFRLRVDYVLPSTDMTIWHAGVWRDMPTGDGRPAAGDGRAKFPSDHFPVWMDLEVPLPR